MATAETTVETRKVTVRKSEERGLADLGWLKSRHTFSFADYHDPRFMGFRTLRVINQDLVEPGEGFGTHDHRDMEIFSYVLKGELQHRDSMGNGRVLTPGQIQLMSAGQGVLHSEFNPSRENELRFLQIWIKPKRHGLVPGYTEWHPDPAKEGDAKVLVISSDGRDGSALIHQDADIYRLRLRAGQAVSHELRTGRGAWLQVIKGETAIDGVRLQEGDGASVEGAGTLEIAAASEFEALLFDLA